MSLVGCVACLKITNKLHATQYCGLCAGCRDITVVMMENIKKNKFKLPLCIGCGENNTGTLEMCDKCIKLFSAVDCNYDFKVIKKKSKKTSKSSKEKMNIEEKSGKIPTAVRSRVWKIAFGELFVGKCECCGRKIEFDNWECGHIQARKCGGLSMANNLRPLCTPCNRSMGTQNLYEFKKKLCNNEENVNNFEEGEADDGESSDEEKKIVAPKKIDSPKIIEISAEHLDFPDTSPDANTQKLLDIIKSQEEQINFMKDYLRKSFSIVIPYHEFGLYLEVGRFVPYNNGIRTAPSDMQPCIYGSCDFYAPCDMQIKIICYAYHFSAGGIHGLYINNICAGTLDSLPEKYPRTMANIEPNYKQEFKQWAIQKININRGKNTLTLKLEGKNKEISGSSYLGYGSQTNGFLLQYDA
jgi:hypothetical protein